VQRSIDRAARLGTCWYGNADLTIQSAATAIDLYREACARHDVHPARIPIRNDIFIAEDRAEAERVGDSLMDAGYWGFEKEGTVAVVTWATYGEFLAFAIILVLIPGPDFAVVTKNTLAAGRCRGRWAAAGVASSNIVQGTAAASGLSALIIRAQPVFEAIKWVGVGYLAFLGAQAIRSAIRGRYLPLDDGGPETPGAAFGGWRQGFLSNITNPKVLIFYLAVLPQFLAPHAPIGWLLAFAWSHALLSLAYLLALTAGLHRARQILLRKARRAMDGVTGAVLLGFSARLAAEHA
jgi:threonine/homoserine/homoserine lactone efflux protein